MGTASVHKHSQGAANYLIIVQPQACCGSGQCGGDCVGPPDTSWGSADDAIIEAVIEDLALKEKVYLSNRMRTVGYSRVS